MTEDEIKDYATEVILEHARDIEYLSVFEMVDQYTDYDEISDEDAKKVMDLIDKATVTVEFPEAVPDGD